MENNSETRLCFCFVVHIWIEEQKKKIMEHNWRVRAKVQVMICLRFWDFHLLADFMMKWCGGHGIKGQGWGLTISLCIVVRFWRIELHLGIRFLRSVQLSSSSSSSYVNSVQFNNKKFISFHLFRSKISLYLSLSIYLSVLLGYVLCVMLYVLHVCPCSIPLFSCHIIFRAINWIRMW